MTHVDGISDDKDFDDMKTSMSILKFSAQAQQEVFRIVAGVLHFGNVKFAVEKRSTSEDACSIVNPEVVAHAAAMWGCDAEMMEKFLTHRHIGTRSIILVSYSMHQAQDARDAMVKRVYAELFQFLVDQINVQLSLSGLQRHKFIGVLDIFGFESFAVNSFEQLCINFCNEKLQFHFNEHIFKMEQALYKEEGIIIPGTAFVDNQPTLDLLEARLTGVFSMVDEEINVPKGSDEGLLQKILMKHGDGKHPNLLRPKAKDCKDFLKNFGVLHYAGPVFYNVTNFLEKNKDQLHVDIISVLQNSSSMLVSKFFPQAEPEDPSAARGRMGKPSGAAAKKTLGFQFKTQLNELIATLNSTFPHFVRCMKSNDVKSGNVFTASRMQDQLRYAGLVEVCRIRKLGYPVRRVFNEFYKRYRCIDLLCPDLDALLASLVRKAVLKEGEWAKGHSRVFMRTHQSAELELAREQSFFYITILVQKHARRMIARKRYRYYKKIITDLEAAIVKRQEAELSAAVDLTFELPYNGQHLAIVARAKVLIARIREERRVSELLQNAINARDINTLKNALTVHGQMAPPFETPLASEAKAVLARLEEELALKAALTIAIANRERAQLERLIKQAKTMVFDCNELRQAETLITRLDKEAALLVKLKDAMAREHLDDLNEVFGECMSQGMDTYYAADLAAAKEVKTVLVAREIAKEEERKRREAEEERQRQALAAIEAKRQAQLTETKALLKRAIASKNADQLNACLQNVIQSGVQVPEVTEAFAALESLKKMDSMLAQLSAALKALQVKADTGINEVDLVPLGVALEQAEKIARDVGDFPEYLDAKDKLENYQKQAKAKAELEGAVSSKDRVKLRAALDAAEDLNMEIDVMKKAREMLKEPAPVQRGGLAPAGAAAVLGNASAGNAAQPYDAAEEARKARQEIAKQARFDVKNFPNLRTADDFARGAILNKSKVKEQFLSFQANVVPKSLTDLNKDYNKLALQIHKDLLGYMGDKQLPFPAMLAQDILRKGYEHKPIRDEIYLQIVKQLTNNPRPESVAKGWQVMCMCVGTFPPSFEFESFLLHYIIEKRDRGRGAVVDYARYCLRTLEAMLNSGDGTGFVPSVEEILAYKERPPILATIYLVDGNVITENLPLTPDLNVAKVIEMCSGWLDLKDSRINTLGMFVYDLGDNDDFKGDDAQGKAAYSDLKRTPRPLRNEDYMGDTIVQKARQRRKFKFVLKRKIFLPKHNYRGEDPFFERMTYLQAEDEAIVLGNIDVPVLEDAVQLAAISMAVAFGEEMPGSVPEMVDGAVLDFVPPDWRQSKSPEKWAELILTHRDNLTSMEPDDLQERFLQIVQKSNMYGSHWFHSHKMEPQSLVGIPRAIQQLPYNLMLAFNADGMHIFDFNRRHLLTFPYSDICRWGGSSSQFSLIMADDSTHDSYEFVLITAQAADMAAIILDHIRAIMAEQEQEA